MSENQQELSKGADMKADEADLGVERVTMTPMGKIVTDFARDVTSGVIDGAIVLEFRGGNARMNWAGKIPPAAAVYALERIKYVLLGQRSEPTPGQPDETEG